MSSRGVAWAGWKARWYLWDAGFLALGRSGGVVPPHSHHAVQIAISLEGQVRLLGPDGQWTAGAGMIVTSDVQHQFDGMGTLVAMLFVDPESHEGNWLRRSLRTPVAEISAARLQQVLPRLREFWDEPADAEATARLVNSTVRSFCAGPPPLVAPDARVLRALEVIRGMDAARLSLEEVARAVFLSPSRFAHLFSQEVGVPFRRYVLWRRLTRAMLAVGRGSTLSAAAHACGFADSAHLTRACCQMFGTPPSVLMKPGEFYEIPGPFELPLPQP